MLQLDSISLWFGERPLFREISATINAGERIGLVGPNGAGKSTLLRIIAGEQQADGGLIKMSKSATVGYLPQDGVEPDPSLSVLEEVEQAFQKILQLREAHQTTQMEMERLDSGNPEYQEVVERFGQLQHQLEDSGSYTLRAEVERILTGLGFKESDLSRPTTEFSGGWLMRIALGKLLLQNPAYLLLDEPTNHLDIESL